MKLAITGRPLWSLAAICATLLALAGCGSSALEFTPATLCSEYNQGNVDSEAAAARQAWNDKVAARYGNGSNMTVSNIPQYCIQKPSASLNEATMGAVKAAGKEYNGME